MEGWALWSTADVGRLEAALRSALTAQGFLLTVPADRKAHVASLFRHDGGTLLVVEHDVPNPALARAVCEGTGKPGRYLELRLDDRAVSGAIADLPDGARVEVDEAAYEILNDWNEGEDRKFRSEAFQPLVEALFDLPEVDRATKAVEFAPSTSPRIATILRAIRDGAAWERTTIGDRPAIRVKDATGTRISVLSPVEQAELETGLTAATTPDPPPEPPPKKPPRKKARAG